MGEREGTLKMSSKREQSYNEKLGKVKAIYESLSKEYNALRKANKPTFTFNSRLCATIQTQLAISERKAQEWIRLVERLQKFQQN